MGRKRNHRELHEARGDEASVVLRRTVKGADELEGFVVGLSDDWVLLHWHQDLRLGGVSAVRIETIGSVRESQHRSVIDRALEFWGERPEQPAVDLAGDHKLLESAGSRFPLVGIYDEERAPDECAVGRVVRVGAKKVDVLDLTPQATWSDEPRRVQIPSITRIDLTDDYLTALAAIAPKGERADAATSAGE